jgi:hypothetical protein
MDMPLRAAKAASARKEGDRKVALNV